LRSGDVQGDSVPSAQLSNDTPVAAIPPSTAVIPPTVMLTESARIEPCAVATRNETGAERGTFVAPGKGEKSVTKGWAKTSTSPTLLV
jgi:hypothetical protein